MGKPKTPKSVKRAEQAEAERQAQIKQATGRIDQIFGSPQREQQYGQFMDALRSRYRTDADRQHQGAARQLRFSMARAGQTGGSVAADAGKTLRDDFLRGITDAENRAQGAVHDLRNRDQQSRLNLIGLAQSGADATTAATTAAEAIRANLGSARSDAMAGGLGDMFTRTADIYRRQQEATARRKGMQQAGATYGNPWSR